MKSMIESEVKFEEELDKTHNNGLTNGKGIGVLKVIDRFAEMMGMNRREMMDVLEISEEDKKRYFEAEDDDNRYKLSNNIFLMVSEQEKIFNKGVKQTDIYSINRLIVMFDIDADEAMELLNIPETTRAEYPRTQIFDVCRLLSTYIDRDLTLDEGEMQNAIIDRLKEHCELMEGYKDITIEQAIYVYCK